MVAAYLGMVKDESNKVKKPQDTAGDHGGGIEWHRENIAEVKAERRLFADSVIQNSEVGKCLVFSNWS